MIGNRHARPNRRAVPRRFQAEPERNHANKPAELEKRTKEATMDPSEEAFLVGDGGMREDPVEQ